MFVKEEKRLLSWLSKELEPLTMADPETLAEYVIALLKNDKDQDALICFCIDQLMDFLKENTKSFVKDLFKILKDESYTKVVIADPDEDNDDDNAAADFNRGSNRRNNDDDDFNDYTRNRDRERGDNSARDRSNRRNRTNNDDNDEDDNTRNKRRRDANISSSSSSSIVNNNRVRSPEKRSGEDFKTRRDYQNIKDSGNREKDSKDNRSNINRPRSFSGTNDPHQSFPHRGGVPDRNYPPASGNRYNNRDNGPGQLDDPFMNPVTGGGPMNDYEYEQYNGMPPHANMMYPPFNGPMMDGPATFHGPGMMPFYPLGPPPPYHPMGSMPPHYNMGMPPPNPFMNMAPPVPATATDGVIDSKPPMPPKGPKPPNVPAPAQINEMPQTDSAQSQDTSSDTLVSPGGGPPKPNAPYPSTSAPVVTTTGTGAPWSMGIDGSAIGTGSNYPYYGMGRATGGIIPTAASTFNYSDMYNSYGTSTITNSTTAITGTASGMTGYSYDYSGNSMGMNLPLNTFENRQSGGFGTEGRGSGGNYRKFKNNNSNNIGGGGSNKVVNDLPEHERCTLLCTGIPTYIKEDDIMAHFRSFGRVVQLQVTSSSADNTTTNATSIASTEGEAAASATSNTDKKSYNECLVQFSTSDEAKKCYSSPTAVLNNRFIRISQSNFNIIPPADVPPPTDEELRELERVQKNAKIALQNPRNQLTGPSGGGRGQPRPPRPILAKPAKNKKYIAGVTPVTAPSVTSSVTNTISATSISGTAVETEKTIDETVDIAQSADGTETTPNKPVISSLSESSDVLSPSTSTTILTPSAPKTSTTPNTATSTSAAPTKQDVALQQQYEDLRKLRTQVDSVWKTKQNLIQQQIDKCREFISKIESSADADSKRDTVEEFEAKIVNLQSQLRSIQEQRVTGALQQQPSAQQQMSGGRGGGYMGRGGRAGRAAGIARGGGRNSTHYGSAVGGRSSWRGGGRGDISGRGRGTTYYYNTGPGTPTPAGGLTPTSSSKAQQISPVNNTLNNNQSKSLLIPATEWTQLPESFTSNIQDHFGVYGSVKSMNSLGNGDLLIEYGSREDAERAMIQGRNYEGQIMQFQWYENSSNSNNSTMQSQYRNSSNDSMNVD